MKTMPKLFESWVMVDFISDIYQRLTNAMKSSHRKTYSTLLSTRLTNWVVRTLPFNYLSSIATKPTKSYPRQIELNGELIPLRKSTDSVDSTNSGEGKMQILIEILKCTCLHVFMLMTKKTRFFAIACLIHCPSTWFRSHCMF